MNVDKKREKQAEGILRFLCQERVEGVVSHLVAYAQAARKSGSDPLPTIRFCAGGIRQFRIRHKFYECF